MSQIEISELLQNNYNNYYQENQLEWRRLGALGKVNNIKSLCKNIDKKSVLEIGAGEGGVLKRLSDVDFSQDLFAVEISSSGIQKINEKRISSLKECSLFDGYNIPYEDQKFDLAILTHVIEHVEYPRKLIYEATRVSKYIFVEVPLEDNLRLNKDFIWDKVGHINFYSPITIRRMLQTCNLEIIDQQITNRSKETYIFQNGKKGLISFYIKEYLLKFFPFLATKLFTYRSSILCRKKQE